MPTESMLEISGLSKSYPGTRALDNVSFDVRPGEVHVLVGENGAGKSTLVRAIGGIEIPDSGTMTLHGESYRPLRAADALASGVQVVHQELTSMPELSVAENLFIQRLPRTFGVVRHGILEAEAQKLLDTVGLAISPRQKAKSLGIAQLQLLEIARALRSQARLLVLDEPTASLTPPEVARLFGIIRRLTDSGVGIVYISHHLDEIFEIGNRVTVLRNGQLIATSAIGDVTQAELVRQMVGRDMEHEYPEVVAHEVGDDVLTVDALRLTPASPPVDLRVRTGEVVGLAGLVGSGRTELVRAIFGADRPASGTVSIHGEMLKITSPKRAVRARMALLTEDRKSEGLLLDLPIAANISLARLAQVTKLGVIRSVIERLQATVMIAKLRIKATGPTQIPRALSGGNQQKVLLARWMQTEPELLIMDEPTRGIDVGARFEIHELILQSARTGTGVLIVSSDLAELIGICDRIVVLSKGRIAGELTRHQFDTEAILTLAYSHYTRSPTTGAATPNGNPA